MVSPNPLSPRKDGGPNVEFFQSAESMAGFETIRQWLMKNCKKVCVCVCARLCGHIEIIMGCISALVCVLSTLNI